MITLFPLLITFHPVHYEYKTTYALHITHCLSHSRIPKSEYFNQ